MKLHNIYLEILGIFKENGIDFPENEARFLICELLGLSSTDYFLRYDSEFSEEKVMLIRNAVKRRISGEPLQYIIGSWDFMGRSFKVGKGVLVPRPETELLCLEILKSIENKSKVVIYDLCSGSGCIGITLKTEHPETELYMVEKSKEALVYLKENASVLLEDNTYEIIHGDILKHGDFINLPPADIIVSNPPYIRSDEMPSLQKEVTFEPEMALNGGADGLVFYRYITENWIENLKPDGEIFFEIGEDQGDDVFSMFRAIGFDSRVIKDYNNHDRIVKGRKASYDI